MCTHLALGTKARSKKQCSVQGSPHLLIAHFRPHLGVSVKLRVCLLTWPRLCPLASLHVGGDTCSLAGGFLLEVASLAGVCSRGCHMVELCLAPGMHAPSLPMRCCIGAPMACCHCCAARGLPAVDDQVLTLRFHGEVATSRTFDGCVLA